MEQNKVILKEKIGAIISSTVSGNIKRDNIIALIYPEPVQENVEPMKQKEQFQVSEILVSHTIVHDRDVMGCQRHEKDILMILAHSDKNMVTDVFMTNNQAQILVEQLQKCIADNNVMEMK